jgi:catechol 2,3-dioxygenase-like lactoylglutathione lyase family enzyme
MPLRVHGLTHVAIRVADLDRSLAFYQRLFGSEVRYRDEKTIELRTPGRHDALTLELGEVPQPGAAGGVGTPQGGGGTLQRGVLHFGFRLLLPASPDDIALEVAQSGGTVEDKGEFVLGEPYVFARDPDGYLIEVFYEP